MLPSKGHYSTSGTSPLLTKDKLNQQLHVSGDQRAVLGIAIPRRNRASGFTRQEGICCLQLQIIQRCSLGTQLSKPFVLQKSTSLLYREAMSVQKPLKPKFPKSGPQSRLEQEDMLHGTRARTSPCLEPQTPPKPSETRPKYLLMHKRQLRPRNARKQGMLTSHPSSQKTIDATTDVCIYLCFVCKTWLKCPEM